MAIRYLRRPPKPAAGKAGAAKRKAPIVDAKPGEREAAQAPGCDGVPCASEPPSDAEGAAPAQENAMRRGP